MKPMPLKHQYVYKLLIFHNMVHVHDVIVLEFIIKQRILYTMPNSQYCIHYKCIKIKNCILLHMHTQIHGNGVQAYINNTIFLVVLGTCTLVLTAGLYLVCLVTINELQMHPQILPYNISQDRQQSGNLMSICS